MRVSVESGEGFERRMTVNLDPEQVERELDKRLRKFAREAQLPGFRPGKVPVKLVRRRFGTRIRQEVLGELIEPSFQEAVAQEQLRPAGPPKIEMKTDPSASHYSYVATFEVLPNFELGTLEGKVLKEPKAEVLDSDVETLIQRLREQNKTFEAVDRPAQMGDRVTFSFEGTIEGEPFEGGSGEQASVELGSGRMIPGFESGFVDMKPGETRVLDLQFPEDYQTESLRGKPVRFSIDLHRVEAPVLPEVDAAFAKQFGIEDGDLERFRETVRENMERELRQRIRARIKKQAMDLLLEANPIELPRVLVEEEIRTLREDMGQRMGGNTAAFQFPASLFEAEARRRVALGLILAEVVKINGIQVDEERVRETVEDLAASYENPQEVIEHYYREPDSMRSVRSLTLEDQVVDWVRSQVTVEEEPSSFAELTKSQGG